MENKTGLKTPSKLPWKLQPYRWAFLHPARRLPRGPEGVAFNRHPISLYLSGDPMAPGGVHDDQE